ncbi:acyl carrier protein [Bermanella sp. R86510]|uniref:acyl carrier protein n=1 Tax=unclassified Bermanella TaxID=2627862 RepID=UPI0037CBC3FE
MSDTFKQVVDVVVEQLGVEADQVNMESNFIEDLGADSLDTVELLMALEEKFDCEIEEDKAEKLTTVKDIVEFVNALEAA